MKKNQRGFSLIELIVVVAIMGIIMGITIPTMSFISRQKVKTTLDINVTKLQQTISQARIQGGADFCFNKKKGAPITHGINEEELSELDFCYIQSIKGTDKYCVHLKGEKHSDTMTEITVEDLKKTVADDLPKLLYINSRGHIKYRTKENIGEIDSSKFSEADIIKIVMGKGNICYSATINTITGLAIVKEGL